MSSHSRRAFTLIELLMVIAILGIVATLAVSKIGNTRRVSAMKMSVANQAAVERAFESYLTMHGGLVDRLDRRREFRTDIEHVCGRRFLD